MLIFDIDPLISLTAGTSMCVDGSAIVDPFSIDWYSLAIMIEFESVIEEC